MADIGYFEQIRGGIYGTPDPGDPATRAALQAQYAQMANDAAHRPGAVPPNYAGAGVGSGGTWSGPFSLPIVGWTCQNSTGAAFHPYNPNVGTTPDWTNYPGSLGAGQYDMNPVVGFGPVNSLNRAPAGPGDCEPWGPSVPPDPNHLPQDVDGGGDSEW